MTGLVIWWILLGETGHKFSDDMGLAGYHTLQQCEDAGKQLGWETWHCFPTTLPEGQPLVISNNGVISSTPAIRSAIAP